MEYKELIERLNEWHENLISEMCADDVFTCDDLCGCTGDCIVVQAVTAITGLLARAEAAETRAAKAERERDAAVSDIPKNCNTCAHKNNPSCKGNVRYHEFGFQENCECWEWRGQKEE